MEQLPGLSEAGGRTLAEVAFLLVLIAGIWIVAAHIQIPKWHRLRMIVAGALLAFAGALLIIAVHWGHFG